MIHPLGGLTFAAVMVQSSKELDDWLLEQKVIFVFPDGAEGTFFVYTANFTRNIITRPVLGRCISLDHHNRSQVSTKRFLQVNRPGLRLGARHLASPSEIIVKRREHVVCLELRNCLVESNSWHLNKAEPLVYGRALLVLVHAERSSGTRCGYSDIQEVPLDVCVDLFDAALDRRRRLVALKTPTGSSGNVSLGFENTETCSGSAVYHFTNSDGTMSPEEYVTPDETPDASLHSPAQEAKKSQQRKPRKGFAAPRKAPHRRGRKR